MVASMVPSSSSFPPSLPPSPRVEPTLPGPLGLFLHLFLLLLLLLLFLLLLLPPLDNHPQAQGQIAVLTSSVESLFLSLSFFLIQIRENGGDDKEEGGWGRKIILTVSTRPGCAALEKGRRRRRRKPNISPRWQGCHVGDRKNGKIWLLPTRQ